MVKGFNLTDIFPELTTRDSTYPFIPRLTFWIMFFNTDGKPKKYDSTGITIRQQVILALQSSPMQMLDKREIWDIVQKMDPKNSDRRSMHSVMWSSDEFEKVTNRHQGNLFRWRPDQMRQMHALHYKGSEMDKILKDPTRGHVIIVENMNIQTIVSVDLH